MRILGYLILLFLALYFILFKPYLTLRKIEWDVDGLGFSFSRGLVFRSLMLLVPDKESTTHLFVRDGAIRAWDFSIGELSLIHVSVAPPSDKPVDYDLSTFFRLAQRLNLSVKRMYISHNYPPKGESFTLFVPAVGLTSGRLKVEGPIEVYRFSGSNLLFVEVQPEVVRLKGDSLFIDRAVLQSRAFWFELDGFWKGKEGSFRAQGRIMPIEGGNYYLGEMNLGFQASVKYTRIEANYAGRLSQLTFKNRRDYQNVSFSGTYLWEWRGRNETVGSLRSGRTEVDFNYSLKDSHLKGNFRGFEVDGRLLGLARSVSGLATGSLELDLKSKLLSLQAFAMNLLVDKHSFQKVSLNLKMAFSDRIGGKIELTSTEPYLDFRGTLNGKNLTGNLSLSGYELREGDFRSILSYSGTLNYVDGNIQMSGRGRLSQMGYKDLRLGSGPYELNLNGDSFQMVVNGDGFSLQGGGSLKEKHFSGQLFLNNMKLTYSGVSFDALSGKSDINVQSQSVTLKGRLTGSVQRGAISTAGTVNFDLNRSGDRLMGNVSGRLSNTRLPGLQYKEGRFSLRFEGERALFSYDLDGKMNGNGQYGMKEGTLNLEGSFSHDLKSIGISTSYRARGSFKNMEVDLWGTGRYEGTPFPLKGQLSLKDEKVKGTIEGFNVKHGIFNFKFEGAQVSGTLDSGKIDVGDVSIAVGHEHLSLLTFEKGKYSGKTVQMEGFLKGAIEGAVKVEYKDGLNINSEGVIQLQKLLPVIRSRVMVDGEGTVLYKLSQREDKLNLWVRSDEVVLRSRFLATPLKGNLSLVLKDEDLSGSAKLFGERGSTLTVGLSGTLKKVRVNMETFNLPVVYRGESGRASLLLSGRGGLDSDFKTTNVRGRYSVSGLINLQKVQKKRSSPPSEDLKRVNLDLTVLSSEPLRINMPEGYVYGELFLKVEGTLYEPQYRLTTNLKSGKLTYFDRDFYIRKGQLSQVGGETSLDLTLTSPTPEYIIVIDVRGNPQYPKINVRSEPPRDTREVLTNLVAGGAETEGLIPVGRVLATQLSQLTDLLKGAKSMTGLDVKVQISTSTSPTGEVGLKATISKDLTEKISVEHRQSTVKNPRESFTGVDVKLTPQTSIGARTYSDRSQEVRVRIRRKFDF